MRHCAADSEPALLLNYAQVIDGHRGIRAMYSALKSFNSLPATRKQMPSMSDMESEAEEKSK